MTEDEMFRWHHHLNGHGFEQALGVGDGQGSLACCSPWGLKEMVVYHHQLDGHEFEQAPGVVMDRKAGVLQAMGSHRVGHD